MRIVIATGIYPSEIGGPALYAEGVKKSLEKNGHQAPLVLFRGLRYFPSGIRHLLYAVKLFAVARGASAIFAFDTYSVGVPAVLVGRLWGIPVVIRIGGDFVWETYLERTKELIPLPEFYLSKRNSNLKERVAFRLVRWMLSHAELAFNTEWLMELWKKPYSLNPARAHVVENVIGERLPSQSGGKSVLLFGRSRALKNAPAFRRTFKHARTSLSLEEGKVEHSELLERIQNSYAVAVPSISEVAPNTVIDAIRCGKPFLLTKYSGYAERFRNYGVIVDPLDEQDMVRGIRELEDEPTYRRLQENIAAFREVRTYDDVTKEFLALLPASRERTHTSS